MRSFSIFAVLFLIIPIIEIFFLIKVGETIGAFPTIILVVLTAVIGAGLLRQQGLSTLSRLQQNMGKGKLPAQELIEGVLLAVGGALLMTPGFVTDTMGFLCLLPFSRKFIAKKIMKHSAGKFKAGVNAKMSGFAYSASNNSSSTEKSEAQYDPNIVEGEFTEVEEPPSTITSSNKK
jgi:UPF0716 protein FxsA